MKEGDTPAKKPTKKTKTKTLLGFGGEK